MLYIMDLVARHWVSGWKQLLSELRPEIGAGEHVRFIERAGIQDKQSWMLRYGLRLRHSLVT